MCTVEKALEADPNIWLGDLQMLCLESNVSYKHAALLIRPGRSVWTRSRAVDVSGVNHHNPLIVRALQGIDPRYKNIHAEADLMMQMRFNQKKTKNHIVIVYGESKAGKRVYSKPCMLCQELLRRMRIQYVVYSTQTGFEALNLRKGSNVRTYTKRK